MELFEGFQSIWRQGASLPIAVFPCQAGQWCGQLSEISYMRSEEIAEPEELSDFVNIDRGFGLFHGPQLISPWFDTFFGEPKTQIGNVFTSKDTLLEIELDAMIDQALEQPLQKLDVLLVSAGVQQEVINVHDDILQTVNDGFHQSLKR